MIKKMTKRLIASAVFCLVSSVAFAQAPSPIMPVYPGPGAVPAGGTGPGSGMLVDASNAASAAFGNLVTAATAASARTSLGLGSGNSPTFTGLTLSGLTSGIVSNASGVLAGTSITGLVLGAGASAPSAYAGTSCSSQMPTSISAAGTFTCSSSPNLTGLTLSSITQGSVLFSGAGGMVSQDNSNFFYDATAHGIRVGSTANPGSFWTRNIFTDASNYEIAYNGDWGVTANVATYGTGKAGTGSTRAFQFMSGGTKVLDFVSGSFTFSGNIVAVGTVLVTDVVDAFFNTAIPAGGTTGTGLRFSSTANFGVFFGSGAPSLSAAKGSLYLRSDGSGIADRAYINTNGSTTWTAVATAG